jgi:hypothetical protein
MKWLFAALLAANLGFWMWASWYKAPAAPSAAAPHPDIHPERIRLITEPGVRLELRASRPKVETLAPASPNVCYRLGPFVRREEAQQALGRLAALGIGHELRTEARATVTGWRVYLPPLPSRAAAEAKRKQLTALGFHDHAVLEEPGMENAVSLGVFAVEANARNQLKLLTEKGVREARLAPLTLARTVHWLWLPPDLPAEKREALAREFEGRAAVQQTPCPPPS